MQRKEWAGSTLGVPAADAALLLCPKLELIRWGRARQPVDSKNTVGADRKDFKEKVAPR